MDKFVLGDQIALLIEVVRICPNVKLGGSYYFDCPTPGTSDIDLYTNNVPFDELLQLGFVSLKPEDQEEDYWDGLTTHVFRHSSGVDISVVTDLAAKTQAYTKMYSKTRDQQHDQGMWNAVYHDVLANTARPMDILDNIPL